MTRVIKISSFHSIAQSEVTAKYTVCVMQEMLDHLARHHDVVVRVKPTYKKEGETDRKSTRLNSSHVSESRMPSSA